MLLNEFFDFSKDKNAFSNDRRYSANRDISVFNKDDTRKTKLTLKLINQLRLQAEAHNTEHDSELGFIQQMYGNPSGEETS